MGVQLPQLTQLMQKMKIGKKEMKKAKQKWRPKLKQRMKPKKNEDMIVEVKTGQEKNQEWNNKCCAITVIWNSLN